MQEGIENNDFLDVTEHDNYMCGVTFESVKEVMKENKLCVIDCKPEVKKLLNQNQSMYIVRYQQFHKFL